MYAECLPIPSHGQRWCGPLKDKGKEADLKKLGEEQSPKNWKATALPCRLQPEQQPTELNGVPLLTPQAPDGATRTEWVSITKYRSTRGQGFKLMKRHCKTDIRKYSFSNRVIENWNLLPIETKNASSINAFKNRIDKIPQLVEKFLDYDDR